MSIQRNSNILFLYDGSHFNPNGSLDNENKPRMDFVTRRCYVSDVRLKRYLRDFWSLNGHNVFVSLVDGKHQTASDRLKNQFNNRSLKDLSDDEILSVFIDARVFGAILTSKESDSNGGSNRKGDTRSFTGPVQFGYGYSLHEVEMMSDPSITSIFTGRKSNMDKENYGSIGKDYRLYYALLAFWGSISAKSAQKTRMTEEDLRRFEEALIKSIPLLVTRTKINQLPRLYLRIEYKDDMTFAVEDPRPFLFCVRDESVEPIRAITDYKLDVTRFIETLKEVKDRIGKIVYWKHKRLQVKYGDSVRQDFRGLLETTGVLVEPLEIVL